MVFRLSVRYVSNSQRSAGSTTFAILRFASAMVAERCRPSASSNALRAAFFSAGDQDACFMNCSGDSINLPTSAANIPNDDRIIVPGYRSFNRSDRTHLEARCPVSGLHRSLQTTDDAIRAHDNLPFPSDVAGTERYLEIVSRRLIHAIANHEFSNARYYDQQDRKARALLAELHAKLS
jgi:hypothetical protein